MMSGTVEPRCSIAPRTFECLDGIRTLAESGRYKVQLLGFVGAGVAVDFDLIVLFGMIVIIFIVYGCTKSLNQVLLL